MRVTLVFIFILVTEFAGSREVDQSHVKRRLELVAVSSGGKTGHLDLFPYSLEAPLPVLNDSVFATVKEYPEGYTGYLCSAEGNIRYTLEPCSQNVWECSDGKLFKKTCAGSSVFWFREGTCEPTCKNKKKHVLGDRWPPAIVHVARVKNVTAFRPLPDSAPVLITADCRNYKRAYFEIKKCHPEYVWCDDGYLHVKRCDPPDWVFDERSHMCGPEESCRAAVPHTQHSLPLSHFIERFDGTPKHAEVMSKMRYPGPINLTMDCNIKKDGDYDHEKCHPNYVRCKFGRRELRACDGGEVFKSSSGFGRNAADLFGYCVEMEECQKLWDEEATMTPVPDELKKKVLSLMLDKKGTLLPNVEDCKDRNGPYAMKPCQAWYMYCYERKGYKMRCSRGFAMSPRYRKCVGKEFCDASLNYD